MKKIWIPLFFAALLFSTSLFAKRLAPKKVAPIIYENKLIISVLQYSRTKGYKQNGGYLVVTDSKTNKNICVHKVYNINYNKFHEQDVQDNFITSLKLKNEFVIVDNEKGNRFKIPVDYLCD